MGHCGKSSYIPTLNRQMDSPWDFMYWTDWITFSVYKIHKYGGYAPEVVFTSLRQPKGIQAIHESRQPLSENKCGTDNGGCSDLCLPSPVIDKGRKYRCVCRDNFTLSYDEKSCVESDFETDVLIALHTVIENQKEGLVLLRELVNKEGDGQVLDKTISDKTEILVEDHKQNTHKPCDVHNGGCWAKGDSAKLLISNISNIGWISTENETKTNNFELFIEKDHSIFLDYDIRDNKLYWTNVMREQILSVDFNDTKNIMVIAENIGSIGIAVDWIHKHLYWTDSDLQQIAVSTLDGQMRSALITKDVEKPRAIVVEPSSGYMYWADWGENPKIEKCGLDGTMREIIVQTDIVWPNAITVDFVDERLYWVDAKYDYIASVDFDGGNRRTVYQAQSNSHNRIIILHMLCKAGPRVSMFSN
ncbi:low-density lipoprotein receptor-related protein 8 [Patella vulgata]|uniref:low-density lipoprotein receptor-related protein 8 n=1 Tax=Patella vulgata TaxID=6465 RepID=UPI0024A8FBEA|nr:low-density lipoprotein receptor-related protein 8 [Patella vulgata]